jgi:hypothetical protein
MDEKIIKDGAGAQLLPIAEDMVVDLEIFTDYCKRDPIKGEIARMLIKEGKIILKPHKQEMIPAMICIGESQGA